jgi:hypothetical protein
VLSPKFFARRPTLQSFLPEPIGLLHDCILPVETYEKKQELPTQQSVFTEVNDQNIQKKMV